MEYVIVVGPAPPEVLKATVTAETYQPFAPAVPLTVAATCNGLGGGRTMLCATMELEDAVKIESPANRARTYSVCAVLPRKAMFPENAPFASVTGNWPICDSRVQVVWSPD